jgi:hypothetical protein
VYGDGGSGTIDYDRPLGGGRIAFWPGVALPAGHLCDGHLVLPHLDSVEPNGHLDGLHLTGQHFLPAAGVRCETPEYYHGVFRHAVRTYDESGNSRSDDPAIFLTVVNSSPRGPRRVFLDRYDKQGDRVYISFEPSPDLAD